ncbi:MAG: hypothetical protein A2428_09325 [Bdellovibrionales bacterium RIFOXYC1_FULL_54_43]|nr:MAG: hypothetical protein A2428_09325 [Bdellovibrionales bacterium RIFOXYC1_FULL_54_43]OFZ80888.1 MAG: hypothetical protein A2603_08215 [Bdellovibrionales bacterium RIFOXYD1_FULL_55_31]
MKTTISRFDEFLRKEKLRFEGVVIGGAALIILDVISRFTEDVDFLYPKIPEDVLAAAQAFAKQNPRLRLKENWFNNGPESLIRDLPDNWQTRLQVLYRGRALKLSTLGRSDLLKTKLFAYCDRQEDIEDCIALAPVLEELKEALDWLMKRDSNPLWPKHCETSLRLLAKRLGYDW